MKNLNLVNYLATGLVALAAGCDTSSLPVGKATTAPGGGESRAQFKEPPVRIRGEESLILRFGVDPARLRPLVNPAFDLVVEKGKAQVLVYVSHYTHMGLTKGPMLPMDSNNITISAEIPNAGSTRNRPGAYPLKVVDSSFLMTHFLASTGYPVTKAPIRLARQGERVSSEGDLELDATRVNDPKSRVERTESLGRYLTGRNDFVVSGSKVIELPVEFPKAPDGYALRLDRVRIAALENLGLTASAPRPSDAWWWEAPDFLAPARVFYPLP